MNTSLAIADKIRKTIIFEGLELEEMGIQLADITDETLLFEAGGLALDSVDGLEIVAGIQREFGIKLENVDRAFMEARCSTVQKLTELVAEQLNTQDGT